MWWKQGLRLEFFPIFIWLDEMEYFDFNRFLSVQIKMILVYKKYIFCEEMFSVLTPWLPIYPCVHAIRCPFLYIFNSEKKIWIYLPQTDVIKCVFVSDYWNDCIDDILFLCNLLEKHYVIFIISWHCGLGGNFLADTLRYFSWPALSRSWHLAASGMGLAVMSHQAGLLTTLHHIHICFPEQGGNMVTTMGWGFSNFRHLSCFTLLINKACMYHNHIPLMYIFNSPANECWGSFSFKEDKNPRRIFLNGWGWALGESWPNIVP